jgi:hypothetical protein
LIPSIDYLTCVIGGAILLAGAATMFEEKRSASGYVLAFTGLGLFVFGTIRALMSALGI